MQDNFYRTMFKYLLEDDKYFSVVYPYLTKELLEESIYKELYKKIQAYTAEYSKPPSIGDIRFLVNQDHKIDEKLTKEIITEINNIEKVKTSNNVDLVIKETEKWVRDETLKSAILDSVEIIDSNKNRDQIYDKIKNAVSISFKNELGMQYLNDSRAQYDFYHSEEETIKCNIDAINQLANGGFRRKSLNCFIGRTGVGKTLFFTHLASDFIRRGYNVVYISAEMSTERIYQRIDANILDMSMQTLDSKPNKKDYFSKVKNVLNAKKLGKLWIKEYPPGYANKLHIQNYLKDLRLKKNFKPDIIILDYLNIFASCKLPVSQSSDSYRYMKSIAEELRALAIEEDIVGITGTQTNRSGRNSDHKAMDDTNTSDSYGIPMSLDFMLGLIQNDELLEAGKYVLKVLKTRYGGNNNEIKTIGVKKEHMRLFDLTKDDQVLPVEVKDKLAQFDVKRKMMEDLDDDGDERGFVFEDELTLGENEMDMEF